MQIWILSKGERHEGGSILGVYADRDLARGAFLAEARVLDGMFGISDAQQDDDGSLHLAGGCDWMSLEPHAVIARDQIEASGRSNAEPPAPPATVRFHNGATAVLDGWSLTEFAGNYYGDVYTQLSGWIDRMDPETPVVGAAQVLHADLPGRGPIVGQDVNVEVTGYGGPRKYMKLRWRSGYDRAADQRLNPA